VSWSSNGSTLAVGYGKHNHHTWCEHSSAVSIWSIFRRDFDPLKPNADIDVGNCVTSLAFHPENPTLLAGGTFNGEIFMWNVFKSEPVVCSSRIDEYYHRESVT
jgi:WD40 repeat protein